MAAERQSPDGVITQTNLTGALSAIQDDPDAPDGNWWTTSDHGSNTVAHVSFPTPTGNPTVGANLQEFKIWIRRSRNKSNTPQCRIDLYENGTLKVSGTATTVNSLTGELKSFTWDATNLANADGSGVEIYVNGIASGGNPANRETVEVGAVEWNVFYSAGAIQYLAGVVNGIASVAGITKVSKKIAGLSACFSSVSGDTKVTRKLAGLITCIGTTAGIIKVARKIDGLVSGLGSVTGSLTVSVAGVLLAGLVSGVASVTGAIKCLRPIAGLSAGLASVSGSITSSIIIPIVMALTSRSFTHSTETRNSTLTLDARDSEYSGGG